MPAVSRDDRVLPVTRLTAAIIVLFLLAAVGILYGRPDETARLWAWTIRPAMTALLMGAGYLAGAYFFVRVLVDARWHEVARGFLPITVFTWLMAIATLLHWDRFQHDHIAFYAWAGLYFTTPVIVPLLWLVNRQTDPGVGGGDVLRLPRRVRQGLAAVGLGILALSLFLFFLPDQAIQVWPWTLTPLTARVVGSFFALPAVSALALAQDPRWRAARIMLESLALAFLLLLIAVARAWGDFDRSNPLTWLYLGSLGGGLLAIAALYLGMATHDRRRRADARTHP